MTAALNVALMLLSSEVSSNADKCGYAGCLEQLHATLKPLAAAPGKAHPAVLD